MSGSARRRGSKWDMKEDISPENRRDLARSNNAGNSFHERESREYMSGRREFQRDDRMNEESMLGWDAGGHYTRRMSPGPDGRRQQSRSRSPRRSRATSYKSKSRSRSQSRSPTHNNLQWEPSVHRNNSKSGHSASLCRDFASGRCKKGDECRFAHHTSPNHDSRRQFESRTVDGWESRRGNDGVSRHHSDPYSSVGRSNTNVCNEFLKGRCTRGASCKYRHHDLGSDEFGKRETDRSYRDGGNDWRNKRGSGYDNEAHISSEPICKFFAAGNCRNGKHCKFSHQRDGQFNHERRSPDGRRREHNLEVTNKVWNDDPNWDDRTSLRRVPRESGWEGEGNEFRDSRNSKPGDWSKDDLNHQPADPNYRNHGNEIIRSNGNQWERNDISVSEIKGIEKGLGEGKMLSPKGTFNSRIGHVDQRSDALPFSQISLPFGEQDTAQRASTENHYPSGINQPNISGDYLQPNPSFPIDITPGVRNNTSLHVNANIPTNFPSGQGISQIDSGYGPLPISADNVGQIQPTTFPVHQLGVENVQMAPHQPVLDSNLGAVQSQIAFAPHNQSEGLQIPNRQPIVDPNQADNLGMSQATTGITLGQNSILTEQIVQYNNLSATLAQLLEKKQQLPQLYAAITQQTASVPTELTKQYDPISDSVETKLAGSLAEQYSSIVGASELPPLNCNPSSIAGGLIKADPKTGSGGDGLQHKDRELNDQEPAVSDKDNGQATENEANETQEALDPGPTDDIALDSGADDNKKAKEAKGIRPFKFALAEFVKELLKPVWKEGKMSKDVYKNIVKKVVDKVTDTIQVAHIPRTKEKIDQYLSLSKPKLNKLTQAYLEKYHKT